MFKMESVDDLWQHIAYVLCYAPNFPYRDFLPKDKQMTLDLAFKQLREGVEIAYPENEYTIAFEVAAIDAMLKNDRHKSSNFNLFRPKPTKQN